MTNETTRIKVWDLPTRIFHWSLVASFAGAWLTAEGERLRAVHIMFGYTLLGLIAFRLVWGVLGTRHARFTSFVTGPAKIRDYLRSLLQRRPAPHIGHNPAGALAIVLLLGLGVMTCAFGLLAYNEVGPEWIGDAHEFAGNAMMALVIVHVLGVVVSSFLHRENLVRAMLNGYKHGSRVDEISGTRRTMGVLLLLAVLGFWIGYAWTNPGLLSASVSAFHAGQDTDDD